MIVYCVEVFVKKGFESDFIEATGANRSGTRAEKGNLRFDLSRSADDPGLFFLYEVYSDEDAVKNHKETSHYLKWRDTVEPWMEKKRYGRMFSPVFPDGAAGW